MMCMMFLCWVAGICAIASAQLHPIQTQDLQSIVDSVKKDVDRHLKMTSSKRNMQSVTLPPEVQESLEVENIDNFLKMMGDSMHHHLIKNLGRPVDDRDVLSNVKSERMTTERMIDISTQAAPNHISKQRSSKNMEYNSESSEAYEIRVGSTKGVPGVHFPNYADVPITSFTCSDKPNPRFYADLETGCQVFHVCWPDRRESFLCPMGTIFNQALQVCDYWYNSNCSLATYYYTANTGITEDTPEDENEDTSSMISELLKNVDSVSTSKPDSSIVVSAITPSILTFVSQFMPIKAKIVVYPETANERAKIVTSATIGRNKSNAKSRQKHRNISKHSRMPRSVDQEEPSSRDASFRDFQSSILMFRISEALDRALMDIKNIEALAHLSEYVESAIKFIKSWLKPNVLVDVYNLEPGSDLFEYDFNSRQSLENLREVGNKFLIFVATYMEALDKGSRTKLETTPDELREAFKPAQLTRLDSRFIADPATEQISEMQHDSSRIAVKTRIKHTSPIFHSSKLSKEHSNIYPETKRALLKNYIKMFKTKH